MQPAIQTSLTLIPPSPITEKVTLEMRAGLRNASNSPATTTVAFHLVGGAQELLLHQETVTLGPCETVCAAFRWPACGSAGEHRIALTVSAPDGIQRIEEGITILASEQRSTDRIGGAWVGLYHWSEQEGKPWNAAIKTMTDEQWREMVGAMHGIGMDIIVLQELIRNQEYVGEHHIERDGYHGKAFYPSRFVPDRMPVAARDPVEAILSEADALGMHVFMGAGMYAWFDFTPGSLEWHKRVVSELWEMYGHHPSLYGWYVSEEIAGNLGTTPERREEIIAFFRAFRAHCRQIAPEKPVMLASNAHGIPEAAGFYPRLLESLDILCPFAFHRMPEGDLSGEEAAETLQRFCDAAGCHLWMDMEVFDFGKEMELLPRSLDGLVSDLRRFPVFEKILCYQFPGLMNAPQMSLQPGGPDTVRAYRDYQRFLQGA